MTTVSDLFRANDYNQNSLCFVCNQQLGSNTVVSHKADNGIHSFHECCILPLIKKKYFEDLQCPSCNSLLEGSSLISYADKKKIHLQFYKTALTTSVFVLAYTTAACGALFGICALFEQRNSIPITEIVKTGCSVGFKLGTMCSGLLFLNLLCTAFARENGGDAVVQSIRQEQRENGELLSYIS